MEHGGQLNEFSPLPSDEELLRRENVFLRLFDKFSVDEGSDPEVMDNDDGSTISEDSSDSGSSFSEKSGYETEENFDLEEINKQLQPIITGRVNAWPEKDIHFQLKTVDRGVSVEEWLQANQEFTTTTKKSRKTIINEKNKTTTITTTTTKTTTSRTSFNLIRSMDTEPTQCGTDANVKISEFESSQEKAVDEKKVKQRKKRTEQSSESVPPNYTMNDLISSKRFDLPGRTRKHSVVTDANVIQNVNRQPKVTPNKLKRLSPNMKLRNRKNCVQKTKSAPKAMHSQSEKASHEDLIQNHNEESSNVGIDADRKHELANGVTYRDANVEVNLEGVLENTKSIEGEEEYDPDLHKEQGSNSTKNKKLHKLRSQEIVIYSPDSREQFGTKIDGDFISVTSKELMERIDPKYHPYTDLSSMKEFIVPVNQKFVYKPPIDIAKMETDTKNDDSDCEDDLLTSYTTAGHLYRLNSK